MHVKRKIKSLKRKYSSLSEKIIHRQQVPTPSLCSETRKKDVNE